MSSVQEFYERYLIKQDVDLIDILRNPSEYQNYAVIAAGKLLTDRGVDLAAIEIQLEKEKEIEQEEEISQPNPNPDFANFEQEVAHRLNRGADLEAVRLSLKEKGYNSFEMLNEQIESDEELKNKRNSLWKRVAFWAAIILIALRIIRALIGFS